VHTRRGAVARFRDWARRNQATLALLLLAPSIPELLTGSTPVSNIVFDPVRFLTGFPLDIALYGSGALLIREFAVVYRKGWASILLLGAAYGIAEEGFEVHTFFQPSGTPVDALGSYGHLFGVNWLWALVLTLFHATYSIALPILLVRLWFPAVKEERWLSPRLVTLLAVLFFGEVVGFGTFVVGHGPSPAALAFFVALVAGLAALAVWAPKDLLWPRSGTRRLGPKTIAFLGAVEFIVYFFVLIAASTRWIPAGAAALIVVLANGGVLAILLRYVGTQDLERSEFLFAVGMLSVLFVWDVLIEFILVPGILAVTALFVYLLYRLDRSLKVHSAPVVIPSGASGIPPVGP
jgi:hypothetical protein